MAKNRMTFEKHQRDAKKKRKQEEKRAAKRKKKELAQSGGPPSNPIELGDEDAENAEELTASDDATSNDEPL